ncbi:MAG: hypothetical protein CM1200mP28_14960 [Deltaproteobacteria bacterium]|nr:MAG: hypothetical protein CM1200mP28_14960 [Deltaproteobacteria bacterium]
MSIVDTWWQTETGGILITPLPGATRTKPGSATRPFFGIQPLLVEGTGMSLKELPVGICVLNTLGLVKCVRCMVIMRDLSRAYFSTYKGLYFTGDGCRRDEEGITGSLDALMMF